MHSTAYLQRPFFVHFLCTQYNLLPTCVMCIALPTCTDIHYVQNMHILTALEDFHFNSCTHNSPSCPPVHCTALGDVQVKRRRIWNKTKKVSMHWCKYTLRVAGWGTLCCCSKYTWRTLESGKGIGFSFSFM